MSKVVMLVIGDSSECGGCAGEKEFIDKNKKKLKDAGIDEIKFILPKNNDKDAKIAAMYRKKYTKSIPLEPITIIKNSGNDTAFIGWSKGKFMKNVKNGIKNVSGKKSKGFLGSFK